MITRTRMTVAVLLLVVCLAVVAAWSYVVPFVRFYTLSATFASTTGIYEGDEVRVAGVPVGQIRSISQSENGSEVEMVIDRSVDVPADASAVIVAVSLVSSRFVQLTPSATDGDEIMAHGTHIPRDRTAVPLEWDDLKTQLDRLTESLGPGRNGAQGAFESFIDAAGTTLDGKGEQLGDTITALAASTRALSENRDDIFETVSNLQTFTTTLAQSTAQIKDFQTSLASVSSTLNDSGEALGTSLSELDAALEDVRRFVADNTDALDKQVATTADVTTVLTDRRAEIERILHTAPTALANYYNIYSPLQGTFAGSLALQNFANPIDFTCGAITGLANATSEEGAKLCAQYLGPVLTNLAVNYPPISTAGFTGVRADPNQIFYSEPELAPGGAKANDGIMPTGAAEYAPPPAGGLSELLMPGAR
ncbi:MAG: MCE family protein [Rhodococcus sp. (in: high G+C Gram-positive bacteria)]